METLEEYIRPMAYFDITIDSIDVGRIIFELFDDITPKTCKNFLTYCKSRNSQPSYQGSIIHRVVPDKVIHGGDITRGDGRGSISIYGETFPDENFIAKHKIEGLLTMANKGPDTNNSQFMITLFPLPMYDGKHVVFGRVVKGYNVVRKIEEYGSELGITKKKIMIKASGEFDEQMKLKLQKDYEDKIK